VSTTDPRYGTITYDVIERTIGLLGGVLLTKRGAGDTWSYPNVHVHVHVMAMDLSM
jgi:hypothetical protein